MRTVQVAMLTVLTAVLVMVVLTLVGRAVPTSHLFPETGDSSIPQQIGE